MFSLIARRHTGAAAVTVESPIASRMAALVNLWEADADQRVIFLRCYLLMTRNMQIAITNLEFKDPTWVDYLLARFADFYFAALDAYGHDHTAAPRVWQAAHDAAHQPGVWALQKLLLGVNAHINYDLVLTLVEVLRSEWQNLTDAQRSQRHADYSYVNEIIGRTIDAVQDQVLEPAMPVLALLDALLGRMDEKLVSRLLTAWRDQVWSDAVRILEAAGAAEQARIIQQVEARALREARLITLTEV